MWRSTAATLALLLGATNVQQSSAHFTVGAVFKMTVDAPKKSDMPHIYTSDGEFR
jgi:hypothetical protein